MPLPIARTVAELRQAVGLARVHGHTVGLVPTMGALHAGHASLIERAKVQTSFVIVTIFVNPMQFGPTEDLDRYPRQLAADVELAARHGASLIFAPPAEEMYPPGFSTSVDVGLLGDVLDGASRPGHFQGVATVVLKLFNIAQADIAVFGQKDAQQVAVLQKMVRDLDVPIALDIAPTVRESDGLALSSRNAYLSAEQRAFAPRIDEALCHGHHTYFDCVVDDSSVVIGVVRESLERNAPDFVRIDYIKIVDAETFAEVERVERPALILVAVYFGTTRLIDNIALNPSDATRTA